MKHSLLAVLLAASIVACSTESPVANDGPEGTPSIPASLRTPISIQGNGAAPYFTNALIYIKGTCADSIDVILADGPWTGPGARRWRLASTGWVRVGAYQGPYTLAIIVRKTGGTSHILYNNLVDFQPGDTTFVITCP